MLGSERRFRVLTKGGDEDAGYIASTRKYALLRVLHAHCAFVCMHFYLGSLLVQKLDCVASHIIF